jgi:hypothetical protein
VVGKVVTCLIWPCVDEEEKTTETTDIHALLWLVVQYITRCGNNFRRLNERVV